MNSGYLKARNRFMRNSYIVFVVFSLCSMLVAQQALSNDSVIKLAKAGLSDDLIISTINSSPGTFDTSVDGIIALKVGGASEKVISAILLKGDAGSHPATPPVPPERQAAQDPDDPMSQHEPGIYLMITNHDGSRKMILLEPLVPRTKETNRVGNVMTSGLSSAKVRAYLPGVRAAIRTNGPRPDFYIYFPSAGTIGLSGGVARPTVVFDLRVLEVEDGQRVTRIAQSNFVGDVVHPKNSSEAIIFTTRMIHPNAFKVVLKSDLGPGEYAFTEMNARATGYTGSAYSYQIFSKMFDFGID